MSPIEVKSFRVEEPTGPNTTFPEFIPIPIEINVFPSSFATCCSLRIALRISIAALHALISLFGPEKNAIISSPTYLSTSPPLSSIICVSMSR